MRLLLQNPAKPKTRSAVFSGAVHRMKVASVGRLLVLLAVAGLCSMLFLTRGVAAPTSAITAPALEPEGELQGAMPLSDAFDAPPVHSTHEGAGAPAGDLPPNSIYKLSAVDIDGKMVSLAKYAGQPAIVVNVASF
jgi:hypothetical protein